MLPTKSKASFLNWSALIVVVISTLSSGFGQACRAEEAKVQPTPTAPSASEPAPRLLLKPGQAIVTGMQTEDVVVTEDVELAKQQVAAYPESPEASFILAVALTRTSMVEEALKEVRRARKLADKQGGPAYFDHMISEYESMLKSYPDDNRVRYGLAWAYYMKAYVLARYSKKVEPKVPAATTATAPNAAAATATTAPTTTVPATTAPAPTGPWQNNWVPSLLTDSLLGHAGGNSSGQNGQSGAGFHNLLHIPGALEQAAPEAVPQIRTYYDAALKNLDDLLARKPDDIWARVYRAFLYAEYTGDLPQAMNTWKDCLARAPNNPAPYFFLGEGYLREGNLKECLNNVSKAIALRSLGN
jgi:tetratricopeptide (TPR) repeat protein